MRAKWNIWFIGLLLIAGIGGAQPPVYIMSNDIATECEGTLLDSGAGLIPGNYNNNENYTFSICVPGADSIVLTFTEFCTEYMFDTLRIFDGSNLNSPQIGPTYSGDPVLTPGTVPSVIVAHSGCLTLHFRSDVAGVTCSGWTANWETIVEEPEPPVFFPIPNPACHSGTLVLNLDQPIPCDSIYPGAFNITGPAMHTVVSATPLNCNGGTTTSMSITLSPTLGENGLYNIEFTSYFLDACDELWELTALGNFTVNSCPISGDITATEETICLGSCTNLTANASGGTGGYSYSWSNGLPSTAGPHTVCPVSNTTYSVSMDDAGPAPGTVATKTITVVPLPALNPGSFTDCQSMGISFFTASPSGGVWHGPGITDTITGRFNPNSAGGGTHTITYTAPNGCSNTMQVTIIPIQAGNNMASCPGGGPFMMTGFYPSGGTWSGPNIQSNGLFDPSTPGSYIVTYTAPNGCSDTKQINVNNITVQADDTVCSSGGVYTLTFSPIGGVWSGPGIVNSYLGRFNPNNAGTGTHTLVYNANGCRDTVLLTVVLLDAGNNLVSCPNQASFILPAASPSGGTWSGVGVVDPVTGLYDPSLGGGNFDDILTYSYNGCADTKTMYVRQTSIGVDTVRFCMADSPLDLDWENVKRTPGNGTWTGPGITDPDYPGTFDPTVAGPGLHTLHYSANTCVDSMTMVVTVPVFNSLPYLCEDSDPITLGVSPAGGVWSGPGIIDSVNGIFDPGAAGVDTHTVYYTTLPDSCSAPMDIVVSPLANVTLGGLAGQYCYVNTNVTLNGSPAGGVYSGNGVAGNTFNPKTAGTGTHVISYTYGTGNCAVTKSQSVTVGYPLLLSTNITNTTICYGDFIELVAEGEGGKGNGYTFSWNNGLANGVFHSVSPNFATTYTVTLSDGCSEPVTQSITVDVHPEMTISYLTNEQLCYGELGFADASVAPSGNYSYTWSSSPAQHSSHLAAPVSTDYTLTVTNQATGCQITDVLELPGFEEIRAYFTPNPNTGECISLQDPVFQFIDLSDGGTTGRWNFGDGQSDPYSLSVNPEHSYADTGAYTVQLMIENEGGCTDSFSLEVCLDQEALLYAPNSFSPNGDGINDEFRILGLGFTFFEMYIYNRWGEEIFFSNDENKGWDGKFKGKDVQIGGYPYVIYYEGKGTQYRQMETGMVIVTR